MNSTPTEGIILAGFLGSGKTTLLNRLLAWEAQRGGHPVVIMSEFGEQDIDGALLAGLSREDLVSVTGGCACCDLRQELVAAWQWAAERRPGARIYLETTGVADPAGVLEALAPAIRAGQIAIRKVVVVHDATRNGALGASDVALMERQVRCADCILLNKHDLVDGPAVDRIIADLGELNPRAQIIPTAHCAIDPDVILAGGSVCEPVPGTPASSGAYRSFAFVVEHTVRRKRLESWLRALPPSVLRVKGFLQLDSGAGLHEVQSTGRREYRITPFSPAPGAGRPEPPMLVVVAHPMRVDGLIRRLRESLC